MRESQKIRLRRLVPGAVAKADGEVAIPISGSGAAVPTAALPTVGTGAGACDGDRRTVCTTLVELLEELIPAEEGAPLASAAP